MSWDFWMERDPEPGERLGIPECDANYTYNVSDMFYDALPCSDGIRGLNGAKGKDCIKLLEHAIHMMTTYPDKYKAMNPENGWGSYEGALGLLNKLKTWCEKYPEAYMVVS